MDFGQKVQDCESTLFVSFSLSRLLEIGLRQSRPVNECSKEEKGGFFGWGKLDDWRKRERNTVSCISYYNTSLDGQNGTIHSVTSHFTDC